MNQAMDRLSELPDSVIHHIFSFLPMVDVVRTTVLSQRWKDLWTTVPCLEFIPVSDKVDKFRDFVYRTLMLFRGSKIQRFRTCSSFSSLFLCPDQNLWVRFAVEHEVEELQISQSYNQETQSLLPQCLFSSSSIRTLLLCGYDIVFHGNICWDRLKSLRILHKRVDQFVVDNVLLGSPQLEILDVFCDESVNICSTSLKNLCIRYYEVDDSPSAADEIGSTPHIRTPNLEVLRVSGSICKKGLFIAAPRLIMATLDLHYGTIDLDYELHGNMLRLIFQCINHVQELTVRDWCIVVLTVMSVLTMMKKIALPSPLLNVKRLTVNTSYGKDCLVGFVDLLKISPNVATLSIENSSCLSSFDEELQDELWYLEESFIPGVEFSDSVLMNLRILNIELYNYSRSVFSLAKLVLKNASALEKIVIRVFESKQADVLVGEVQKLLKMPRPSPNAEIVLRRFKFIY